MVNRVNDILSNNSNKKDLSEIKTEIKKLAQRRQNLLNLVSNGDTDAEILYCDLTSQQQVKEAELETEMQEASEYRPMRVTEAEINRNLMELRYGLEQDHISQKK